jgi:hypothetical protein
MGAHPDRADRLLVKATYGLETALLLGLGCVVLAAHRPERPGAGILLLAGLLLLALSAAATATLRRTGLGDELFRHATRQFRGTPSDEGLPKR